MYKVLIGLAICAAASFIAAIFGALHNQISYSVGPDYFHGIKFNQFGTDPHWPPRLAAAWVGVQATWWAGVFLSIPVAVLAAIRARSHREMWAMGRFAIVLVPLCGAALSGLGLGAAALALNMGLDTSLPIPKHLSRSDFLLAGAMHDGAYMGAMIGALCACLSVLLWRRRER